MRVTKKNKSSKKLIITLVIIFVISAIGVFTYLYAKQDKSNPESLPTVQTPTTESNNESENTQKDSDTTSNSSSSSTTPTKTEGKTPSQYEGETVDDEPAYDNEQFRIPEEDM